METRSQDPTAPTAEPADNGSRAKGVDGVSDSETPGDAFHAAQQTAAQLVDYARYYIAARLDALKLSARNALIIVALAIVAAIAGAALVVTATALLCIGMAQAISALCHTGPWLGNLVTAIVLLGGIALGARIGVKRIGDSSRERTVKKYAARQQQQRAKFGEDVSTGRGPVD